ncbi:nuclear transport factor 2 family protein [Novosphingobium sp. FKTRR1]|uniref:nuclear transport factor 2 family protein n=1 Tax=Novosphingobium sp. FKTRR1 TaxID=2879118 RepID=UPI001CF02C1F|nr:nuclear transport factor 2 family protein [Novosphingobium sp. FKTRR1]
MKSRTLPGRFLAIATIASLALAVPGPAQAQAADGHWAAPGDPVAADLLEMERVWATLACVPADARYAANKAFVEKFIADDFVGTSPAGPLYTKADMLPKPGTTAPVERDCKVLGAKVRFFTPDLAVIYGSESAIVQDAKGNAAPRELIWTDTVLRRAGQWQIIAVQDMTAPKK